MTFFPPDSSPFGGDNKPVAQPFSPPAPGGDPFGFGAAPASSGLPVSSGFPMQPAMPAQVGYPYAAVPVVVDRAPTTIWVSFGAMVAAGVVNVIAAIMLVVWIFDLKDQATTAANGVLSDDPTGLSAAEVGGWADNVATSVSMTFAAILLALAAVYVLMAFLVKAGKNPARITATVFAGFSVFGFFFGPYAWAVVLLGIVATVAMWLPQSSAYFEHRKMLRRGYSG